MNFHPRTISVTLAIGLFTTTGVAQAERGLIKPSHPRGSDTVLFRMWLCRIQSSLT